MGSENQDLEIITAFQKRRRNRLLRIGAVLAALVLSYFVCLVESHKIVSTELCQSLKKSY